MQLPNTVATPTYIGSEWCNPIGSMSRASYVGS